MISVEKAIALIEKNYDELGVETIHLENSLGFTIASDIISPINMPPFKQSAMDGYAINFDNSSSSYKITDEIQAGKDPSGYKILKGEAARIFTGAVIPEGATSVIQQEWCVEKNKILSFSKKLQDNLNIRPVGEQLKKGEKVLSKGHVITPATIGLLAGLGLEKIAVYKEPSIALIITGNELIKPGSALTNGKIYESNSTMLIAALHYYGYKKITTFYAKDNFKETVKTLNEAINGNDVILMSGGISVGDYDFVLDSSKELDVKEVFYKVKQKPGKPLFFGKKNKKAIFGLPGNPGASLTCFYIYVLRYLSLMTKKTIPIKTELVTLSKPYFKKGVRAEFLKAKIANGVAEISSHQNSSMLRSYSEANGLLYIKENTSEINKGDKLDAYLLL